LILSLYPIYRSVRVYIRVCIVCSLLFHSLYSYCHALVFHNKLELTQRTFTYNLEHRCNASTIGNRCSNKSNTSLTYPSRENALISSFVLFSIIGYFKNANSLSAASIHNLD
jgi:hypothetical protein